MQVGGLLTKPLIWLLLNPHKLSGSSMASELSSNKSLSEPLLFYGQESESTVDTGNPLDSNHTVHYYWRIFDNSFMRPVFGGRGFTPIAPASSTEMTLQ